MYIITRKIYTIACNCFILFFKSRSPKFWMYVPSKITFTGRLSPLSITTCKLELEFNSSSFLNNSSILSLFYGIISTITSYTHNYINSTEKHQRSSFVRWGNSRDGRCTRSSGKERVTSSEKVCGTLWALALIPSLLALSLSLSLSCPHHLFFPFQNPIVCDCERVHSGGSERIGSTRFLFLWIEGYHCSAACNDAITISTL